MNRTDRFDDLISDWLHADPSIACPSTSMPSSDGPGRNDSTRHGRAFRGGSPWIP